MSSPVFPNQSGREIRRYKLVREIGAGSFGAVYEASTLSIPVAVKLVKDKTAAVDESEILLTLQGCSGVPQWLWFGEDLDDYVIVMTLGYKDLTVLRRQNPDRSFSKETVQKILFQAVNILEMVHQKGILHRDVKCNNFIVSIPEGRRNKVTLQLIDFGLAINYQDEDGNLLEHPVQPQYRFNNLLHSTPSTMQGNDHTPADDLIQLTYVGFYLSHRNLKKFRTCDQKAIAYKQKLLYEPETALPKTVKWMSNFFQCVGDLYRFVPVNYEAIRDSIRGLIPDEDPARDLFLTKIDGCLHLL